ncbi:MAG: DUF1232 domain-containing protein [Deltaproteobacteria bacterium]|nr:MAG: DUF1232 domain-containing protein [Deltaproteobacteria bacterium]
MAANAEALVDTIKEWVGSLREDVATCKAVVEAEAADPAARRFAATALNYLVTRLDLIPDHEPAIGAIDDAMAIRVCMRLASDHDLDKGLGADVLVEAMRLANEAERLDELLGEELAAAFRKHVERMSDDAVRGRTPEQIVEDAGARARLFEEVEADLLRMPPAAFGDAADVARQLTSYLKMKLS